MTESIKKELEQDNITKHTGLVIENQWTTIDSLISDFEQFEETLKKVLQLSLSIIQNNCSDYENLEGIPELLYIYRLVFSGEINTYFKKDEILDWLRKTYESK